MNKRQICGYIKTETYKQYNPTIKTIENVT